MYNKYSTTYTEDRVNLCFTMGVVGLSLMSYTSHNQVDVEGYPITTIHAERDTEETEESLTKHAMNLSSLSLVDDWKDEDDNHWASFL